MNEVDSILRSRHWLELQHLGFLYTDCRPETAGGTYYIVGSHLDVVDRISIRATSSTNIGPNVSNYVSIRLEPDEFSQVVVWNGVAEHSDVNNSSAIT